MQLGSQHGRPGHYLVVLNAIQGIPRNCAFNAHWSILTFAMLSDCARAPWSKIGAFVSGELGDIPKELGDIPGELGDIPGKLGDIPGELGDIPEC